MQKTNRHNRIVSAGKGDMQLDEEKLLDSSASGLPSPPHFGGLPDILEQNLQREQTYVLRPCTKHMSRR